MARTIKHALPGFGNVSWPWVSWFILVAIYLASVTACGAWDPWETHYGEVARNILVRGDPLDLWWKPGYGPSGRAENVFYSKHALPFWCMALGMWVFGVGTSPDPAEMVQGVWPELALRTPSMLLGLGATLFLAWVVGRLVSRRAGWFTGLALATMPQFAIVSRQAITDIYFVAPTILSLGAWMMAWCTKDAPLRRHVRFGRTHCARDPLWRAFFVIFALAAITPLLVLHIHVVRPQTVARVARFAKAPHLPTVETLETIAQTLWIYWGLIAAVLISSLRWVTRRQVWMGFVYIGGGLALMGKGFLGPGLIGLLILVDMLVSGRIRALGRVGLVSGVLIFIVVCVPWHHAMWLYRGEKWFHELIIQNNLSRFISGEQDQAVGDFGFYLRTFGLAAFPWSVVMPLALVHAVQRIRGGVSSQAGETRLAGAADAIRVSVVWLLVALGLVSYSVTKYYHYLLPALPPAAVLAGVWLDRMWGGGGDAERRTGLRPPATLLLLGAAAAGGVAVLMALMAEPAWIAHLTTYLYTGMWRKGAPDPTRMWWCSLPLGLALLAYAIGRGRLAARGVLLSAYLCTFYILDDYLPAASESWSQRSAFQTYFRERSPNDRILSWWFYYRGETFFTKSRIWVSMTPNRDRLNAFIKKHRDDTDAMWMITIDAHARRIGSYLPADLRDKVEVRYENHHYVLLRVPLAGDASRDAASSRTPDASN